MKKLRLSSILIVLFATSQQGFGQYQVQQWANFEDGLFPPNLITIGVSPATPLQVVDLSQVANQPSAFYGSRQAQEAGRYALRLKSAPGAPNSGVALGFILDRDELTEEGQALFQADFYLPDEKEMPSLAVLAMEPPPKNGDRFPDSIPSIPAAYYRFGLTKGTIPYFSCYKPEKERPVVYQADPDLLPLVPKPGWHRFAIVLKKGDKISCFIDGRPTTFSPTHEKTLRRFMVGILLADSKRTYDCYVDNLSIQVSEEPAPLPESPYGAGWKVPPGDAKLRKSVAAAGQAASTDERWLEPLQAWKKAQEARKPLLLFFYSPGSANSDRVNALFDTDPSARAFLAQNICSRLDVNQLQGGTIAKQYQVYKVPTLLLISPDARSHSRVVPSAAEDWNSMSQKLEEGLR